MRRGLFFLFLVAGALTMPAEPTPPVSAGIAESLAQERVASISAVRYELHFRIPDKRTQSVQGKAVVRFALGSPSSVVLDFGKASERVRTVRSGAELVQPEYAADHLIIPAANTHAGENSIEIEFIAGDEALNRNDEFLYTLAVPARAHWIYPCFDQPDLKARYTLTLQTPDGWQSVSNGASNGVTFAETEPIPTYLFAFATGKFSVETAQRNGRTFRMFHRETDAQKVARNREAVFDLHAHAIAWLEEYTGIAYPWGKFDFVLLPAFQFGGMEHPGAVFYNAASVLLDESATQNQQLNRANLISHETSHMWFGDLVTMRWFNDVWMKEVMANFMAAKIVNPSFPDVNHELRFLLDNYPTAYSVDRTAGTNPIRQTLANLDEAGSLYGAIIYQKAPIVMRQLETITGVNQFRDGLRVYLKTYQFGNATWQDLIRILDPLTPEDLAKWSHAWVEERGRPTIETRLSSGYVTLVQPDARWPQRLQVQLGSTRRPVSISKAVTRLKVSARPAFVLPNGGGIGYGLFLLDPQSRTYLLNHVEELPDALTRGSAWVTLWDNLLEAKIAPGEFIDATVRALPNESDEQNTQRILSYLSAAFWKFLTPAQRGSRSNEIEVLLKVGLARADTASRKSAWFNTLTSVALTRESLQWLEEVWSRRQKVPGLPLAETDEITLAMELAVRGVPDSQKILEGQLERTQNPDRKARFAFVMPSLSADPNIRSLAFERFKNVENRGREPWVTESMRYLNHPLRSEEAVRYIAPSLELLTEIQKTGDIFFPRNWTEALLAGHNTNEAAIAVRHFLDANPQLPLRLRWVVLSAADQLFRAQKLLPM